MAISAGARGLRVFGQLQAADVSGREGGPRPSIDRTSVDLQQVFVESASSLGVLRIGRQELDFGTGRLISLRAGPINVRLPQDGVRWFLQHGPWRTDLFAVRVVEIRPNAFDDTSTDADQLFGAQIARGTRYVSPMGIEAYFFRRDRNRAAYFDGVGAEERNSVGTRVWHGGGGWTHELEIILQFGSVGQSDVLAWAGSSRSTYSVDSSWNPSFELAVGVNSGDGDPRDGDIGTFVAPLPRGAYFGQFAPFGPANLQGARASATVTPRRALAVTGSVYGFWRWSTDDGLYGVSGFPFLPARNGEKFVGTQTDLNAIVSLGLHVEVEVGLTWFQRGGFLEDSGAPNDMLSFGSALRTTF